MKARVKATGEIVYVLHTSNGDYEEFVTHNLYCPDELVFDVTDKDAIYNKGWQDGWDEAVKSEIPKIHPTLKGSDPDYWTRLEHQYAGMAMQGMMSNISFMKISEDAIACGERVKDITARMAIEYAHALVEKLKEKEERK
jgi:hypothetical protein